MKNDQESWGATFEETRLRQMLLGLEMTPLERLRWLDQRRAELQRLSRAMSKASADPEAKR